jgi:hypothetical protein
VSCLEHHTGRPHAICRRADSVRHAGVCTPVWEGVQPLHAFFLGVRGGVRTPFGRAAIKPLIVPHSLYGRMYRLRELTVSPHRLRNCLQVQATTPG